MVKGLTLLLLVFAPKLYADNCAASLTWVNKESLHTKPHYKYGLVPETAPGSDIVLTFDSAYWGVQREILLRKPDSVRAIMISRFGIRSRNGLKSEHRNDWKKTKNKKYQHIDLAIDPWSRDWVPQVVRRRDGSFYLASLYNARSWVEAEGFAKKLGVEYIVSDLVGEMGNIMVDGHGRLFTTKKMLEDNIGYGFKNEEEVTRELKRIFGVKEVHYISYREYELTKHIDMSVKYVGKRNGKETVLVAESDWPGNKHKLNRVAGFFRNKLGFEVVRMKDFSNIQGGVDLVKTWLNSLVIEDVVFVPEYESGRAEIMAAQERAYQQYRDLGFKVIPIPADQLVRNKGSVHCFLSWIPAIAKHLLR